MLMTLPQLSSEDVRIIEHVLHRLQKRYRRSLRQVILYGSKARGDATEESDIDLLVVLSSLKDFWRTVEAIGEIADEILLEAGIVVSAIPITEAEVVARRASPFLMNVNREGIVIYEQRHSFPASSEAPFYLSGKVKGRARRSGFLPCQG